jgi:replicative DNA helicase
MTTQLHAELCEDIFAWHTHKLSSVELERTMLSTILHDPKTFDDVQYLTKHHFTDYHCREFFALMSELHRNGKQPEFTVMAQEIEKVRLQALAEVFKADFKIYQAKNYAQALHELYTMRTMLQSMKYTLNRLAHGAKAHEAYEEMRKAINTLETHANVQEMQTGEDVAIQQIKQLEQYLNGKAHICTGLSKLDGYTGGIANGLTIIGAKSGIGKTAFLCSIAHNMMSKAHKVGILSGEMKAVDIADRFLTIHTNKPIANTHYKQNDLKKGYSDVIQAAAEYPYKHKYLIDDSPLHVSTLRGKIARMAREGCEVIFLDYLQRIKGDSSTLRETIIEASMTLANCAKEYSIPIVALVQLNRETDKSPGKEPELHHIAESGQIEMDADLILLLHRPEKYGAPNFEDGADTKGRAEVIIAKNRFGEIAKFRCDYVGELMKFQDTQQNVGQYWGQ